jgi:hypothetical protein
MICNFDGCETTDNSGREFAMVLETQELEGGELYNLMIDDKTYTWAVMPNAWRYMSTSVKQRRMFGSMLADYVRICDARAKISMPAAQWARYLGIDRDLYVRETFFARIAQVAGRRIA